MRRLIYIFVTERAFKLRPFFFCHVLPVIELNRLARRFGFSGGAQQDYADDDDYGAHNHN